MSFFLLSLNNLVVISHSLWTKRRRETLPVSLLSLIALLSLDLLPDLRMTFDIPIVGRYYGRLLLPCLLYTLILICHVDCESDVVKMISR